MYGYSYLFQKPLSFTNVMSLNAVMTATIEFYTYSGNNGVATREYAKDELARYNTQLYGELNYDRSGRLYETLEE